MLAECVSQGREMGSVVWLQSSSLMGHMLCYVAMLSQPSSSDRLIKQSKRDVGVWNYGRREMD